MKKIKFLSVILFIFLAESCATVDTDKLIDRRIQARSGGDELGIKNIFSYVSKCTENPGYNSEFCDCVSWAKDESGKVPIPSFGESEKDYLDKAVPNLMGYFEKIDKCEQYAPMEIDFDIPPNTALANQVLKENEGKILTPDNLDRIEPLNYPKGWKYKMDKANAEIDFSNGSLVYQGKDEDGDLFIYSGSTSEYVYISGIKHFRNKKTVPFSLNASDEAGECKFVIGPCVYGHFDDRKKVVTKFENGVWIRNVGSIGFKRALYKAIYDINGIPLYEFYKSQKYTYENIRHESNTHN